MTYRSIILVLITSFTIISCQNRNPNITSTGKDEFKSREISRPVNNNEMIFEDVIYVPIYSDVYVDQQNQKCLLAATLSIRNTSFKDSLFINTIDYYDTDGRLVRKYIENTISLRPMATVNYVIEREDVSGGSGANFIVALGAKSEDVRPLIQAVMIGEASSNKGFAFAINGYSIDND